MSDTTADEHRCNAMVEAFNSAVQNQWDTSAVAIFDECLTRLTEATKPDPFHDDFRTSDRYRDHLVAARSMLGIYLDWSRDSFARGCPLLKEIPRRFTNWMKTGDAAHWEAEFSDLLKVD